MSEQSVDFPMVLPAQGTIKSLAASFDVNNPTPESISLLLTTLSYVPNSDEWELVADKLVGWSSNPNRPIGNDEVYALMARIFLECNEVTRGKIVEVLTSQPFIVKTTQENISKTNNLLVLCAVALKNKLLTSGLGTNISNYWLTEYDNHEDSSEVVSLLRNLGVLDNIWLLARDVSNEFAIGVIRSGLFDSELYVSEYGPIYVDDFEWASDDDKKEIIIKSIKYGGLSNAREEMISDPVGYRSCFKIIKSSGVKDVNNIVDTALKSTTAAQWAETLKSDADLFDCLGTRRDYNFKEGFITFAEEEFREGELSSHVWDKLDVFAEKLMDSDDVFEKLTKTYFELEKDPLSDDQFRHFSALAKIDAAKIKSDLIGKRIETWLTAPNFDRIIWLLNSNFRYEVTPSESLCVRIKDMYKEENDHKDMILALASKLNIDIPPDNNELAE